LTFAFICVYLRPLLRGWRYHKYLESVTLAGSHAKGTDLKDSDVDIFLRLSHVTPGPLSAMQTSLADHLHGHVRNVAVRIMHEGRFIDLVPARGNTLWQARFNTWLKTDIAEQIRYVRDSGFIDEILALKIWRRRHALRFPSFLMELATIHALSRKGGDCPPISKNQSCTSRNSAPKSAGCPLEITESFPALLRFLATDFPTTRLLDPANSNNVVSDLLTEVEKLRIARTARLSLWGKWGQP
jgi:predicted nucleotidyltransferase